MQNPLDFSGRTVFVMGGTSGINLGVAEAFADCGATVGVASRSEDKVRAAVEKLSRPGRAAHGFAADVRDPEALQKGLDNIGSGWGRIDVLIAGQAGNFPAPALGMSPNAFKSVVDIDLLGTFNLLRHAHRYLAKPGACVINISAPQALVAMELQAHVCAAKAGVDMLTRVLALEWGPQGIRVNSIMPGPIEGTEGMKRLAPTPQIHELVRESIPLKRLGTPRDIANCALFLASPLGGYVNGAVIPVDGGQVLNGAGTLSRELAKLFEQHSKRETKQ
ncbi:MAG TPA: SDR family oxidoreductase [Gammaproteobacteria bacterium]|jgi:NAD(P)-dependent dehydrogenase (short-subunit alcohol dehydrogenase family)